MQTGSDFLSCSKYTHSTLCRPCLASEHLLNMSKSYFHFHPGGPPIWDLASMAAKSMYKEGPLYKEQITVCFLMKQSILNFWWSGQTTSGRNKGGSSRIISNIFPIDVRLFVSSMSQKSSCVLDLQSAALCLELCIFISSHCKIKCAMTAQNKQKPLVRVEMCGFESIFNVNFPVLSLT